MNQCLTTPVREISDDLSLKFLPVCSGNASSGSALFQELERCQEYQFVAVENFCPTDSSSKYRSLKANGPTALLNYSHGNNVGNLSFLWKSGSSDEASFARCQPVIECVKQQIPVFHTIAMRREMFQRFGRLTSSVKPAVMRHIYRALTGENLRSACGFLI